MADNGAHTRSQVEIKTLTLQLPRCEHQFTVLTSFYVLFPYLHILNCCQISIQAWETEMECHISLAHKVQHYFWKI